MELPINRIAIYGDAKDLRKKVTFSRTWKGMKSWKLDSQAMMSCRQLDM